MLILRKSVKKGCLDSMHSQWEKGKGMDEKKNDRYNGQFFLL